MGREHRLSWNQKHGIHQQNCRANNKIGYNKRIHNSDMKYTSSRHTNTNTHTHTHTSQSLCRQCLELVKIRSKIGRNNRQYGETYVSVDTAVPTIADKKAHTVFTVLRRGGGTLFLIRSHIYSETTGVAFTNSELLRN